LKLYLNSNEVNFSNGEITRTESCLSFKQLSNSNVYVYVENDYWVLSKYLNMFYEYKRFKNYTINQFLNILNIIQERGY
jgi:hypothetical protein